MAKQGWKQFSVLAFLYLSLYELHKRSHWWCNYNKLFKKLHFTLYHFIIKLILTLIIKSHARINYLTKIEGRISQKRIQAPVVFYLLSELRFHFTAFPSRLY